MSLDKNLELLEMDPRRSNEITASLDEKIQACCQEMVDEVLTLDRITHYIFSDNGCGSDALGNVCEFIDPSYNELLEAQFKARDRDLGINARLETIEEQLKLYIGAAVVRRLPRLCNAIR